MTERFEAFTGGVIELNRYLQRIKDLEMRRFGLRFSHAMCLYYLGQNPGGLTATQLTALCHEDKAAISRCLAQLTQKQLVISDAPTDKRSYRTLHTLTEEGRSLTDKMNARVEAALFNGGSGLSQTDREIFYRVIDTILQNLEKYTAAMEQSAQNGEFLKEEL